MVDDFGNQATHGQVMKMVDGKRKWVAAPMDLTEALDEIDRINGEIHVLVQQRQDRCELRDQFAMAALTGLVGNHDLIGAVLGVANKNNVEAGEVYARMAYEQADAMLNAREGKA